MQLGIEEIKKIAAGAVRVEEENGVVRLYRFTKEQEEVYRTIHPEHLEKTFATAGIKLLFQTDSKTLALKIIATPGSSRKYFSFDVFVDGKPIGYLDNFSDTQLPEEYPKAQLPLGEVAKTFQLGDGLKTVCVYFPWSVSGAIKELSVDDGALVEGVKPEKKLLAFGDSITHGYDAQRPSMRYAARLAESLGAEEVNKAIGGERFFPQLAEQKEPFTPDYITVAYGTNDWNGIDEATFQENCQAFYTALSKNYPEAKIFALTPIWRKDFQEERAFGAFAKVEEDIRNAVKDLANVTVISGFDFVPKDEKYFADFRLHPNDAGFDYYFKNLCAQVQAEF